MQKCRTPVTERSLSPYSISSRNLGLRSSLSQFTRTQQSNLQNAFEHVKITEHLNTFCKVDYTSCRALVTYLSAHKNKKVEWKTFETDMDENQLSTSSLLPGVSIHSP